MIKCALQTNTIQIKHNKLRIPTGGKLTSWLFTRTSWLFTRCAGLSIGFEVDGDILKVDSYMYGAEGPHSSEGSGAADAPSGVQGQSPVGGPGGKDPGSKMNLMFDIAKN